MSNPASRLALLSIGLVIAVLLAACGTSSEPQSQVQTPAPGEVVKTAAGNQYRDVTADELKAMMDKKDFFLVDVHIPNQGKLPQLDARIAYNEIADNLDKLPADKSAKIVLTCMSGGMSTLASQTLADLGYSNVYNLKGGFNSWRDKGYDFTPEP
ncbi:MAG: rhodanese-like domain-containing protein [Chloroflexota bacterium]|nr:rhodanese-like domain-containing protein [Chloroflexota bacterium]